MAVKKSAPSKPAPSRSSAPARSSGGSKSSPAPTARAMPSVAKPSPKPAPRPASKPAAKAAPAKASVSKTVSKSVSKSVSKPSASKTVSKAPSKPSTQAKPSSRASAPSSQSRSSSPSSSGGSSQQGSSGLLAKRGPITQYFGQRSNVEKYSRGVNYGTDFAVPTGTKVSTPPGKWKVVEAFTGARAQGPNNPQQGINRGYGNSVLLQNIDTGEKLRMSHLSQVGVQPGSVVPGGSVIGMTGATGNVAGRTGQHLDLEYYNHQGKVNDFMRSPYAQYLYGGAQPSTDYLAQATQAQQAQQRQTQQAMEQQVQQYLPQQPQPTPDNQLGQPSALAYAQPSQYQQERYYGLPPVDANVETPVTRMEKPEKEEYSAGEEPVLPWYESGIYGA